MRMCRMIGRRTLETKSRAQAVNDPHPATAMHALKHAGLTDAAP